MDRTLIYIAAFFCMIFALPLHVQAEQNNTVPQFFSALQDVPLMPGLNELPDQAVIFDKAEGRIIESVAHIENGTNESVAEYYAIALPQLGWQRVDTASYVRGDEHLRFAFETIETQRFFRIMIEPN